MIYSRSQSQEISWFVEEQVKLGNWREETVNANIVGLSRDISIFRASRKTNIITYDWHGDKKTFCPPMWWDLAIGSGACGLGCRACFLMLTHRVQRDPSRHLLYDNLEDFIKASCKWLLSDIRRSQHTLGVGIDRSDSLLYEGVVPHVRSLAPLFTSESSNPHNCKLILLTKTANTHYLKDISEKDRFNIIVTFSLNPEEIADLWEGKWADGVRITPSIERRLQSVKLAQELGYEVRIRLDPILTPSDWEIYYTFFVRRVKELNIHFKYWTLGTYREKNSQLDLWRKKWQLPAMEWEPDELIKSGTHRHLPDATRIDIYQKIISIIHDEFPSARVSLCKETHVVRQAVKLCNADCNCLR